MWCTHIPAKYSLVCAKCWLLKVTLKNFNFLHVFDCPCKFCHIFYLFLADPGKARGCSKNSLVIHQIIHLVSQPFPPTALRRRHATTVRDSSSSYKINYFIVIQNLQNPKGHQNLISGSKVTAILLKGWIWLIGGVASGRVCVCSLRSRLVSKYN